MATIETGASKEAFIDRLSPNQLKIIGGAVALGALALVVQQGHPWGAHLAPFSVIEQTLLDTSLVVAPPAIQSPDQIVHL